MRTLCIIFFIFISEIVGAKTIERKIDINNLVKFKIESFGDIIISKGEEESIRIVYEEEYKRYIQIDKNEDNIHIYIDANRIPKQSPKLFISIKEMKSLKIINCGDIKLNNIDIDSLDLLISSCNNIYLDNITLSSGDFYLKSSDNIVFSNVNVNVGHLKIAACKDVALFLSSKSIKMGIKASDDVNIKGEISNLSLSFSTIDEVNVDASFDKAIISSKCANIFKLSANTSKDLDLSICYSKKIVIGGKLNKFILNTSSCNDLYLVGESSKFIYNNLGVDKCNMECFTYNHK